TVGGGHGDLERGVVGDLVYPGDRVGQFDGHRAAGLDQRQHQGCGTELEVGRGLRQGGVPDDHVEPPVLVGVGVRLVAGVDQPALQGGFQADLDLDVVGPLGQLESVGLPGGADADPSSTCEYLAGGEERQQPGDQ